MTDARGRRNRQTERAGTTPSGADADRASRHRPDLADSSCWRPRRAARAGRRLAARPRGRRRRADDLPARAGPLPRRQAVGHEGHRVLPRLRPAHLVVPAGRDRVRRQGHPRGRLRAHHRHAQPRRGRARGRAPHLPPAELPEAAGRRRRRLGDALPACHRRSSWCSPSSVRPAATSSPQANDFADQTTVDGCGRAAGRHPARRPDRRPSTASQIDSFDKLPCSSSAPRHGPGRSTIVDQPQRRARSPTDRHPRRRATDTASSASSRRPPHDPAGRRRSLPRAATFTEVGHISKQSSVVVRGRSSHRRACRTSPARSCTAAIHCQQRQLVRRRAPAPTSGSSTVDENRPVSIVGAVRLGSESSTNGAFAFLACFAHQHLRRHLQPVPLLPARRRPRRHRAPTRRSGRGRAGRTRPTSRSSCRSPTRSCWCSWSRDRRALPRHRRSDPLELMLVDGQFERRPTPQDRPAHPSRSRRGRRRCPDHGAVDDDHQDGRRRGHAGSRSTRWPAPAATSSVARATRPRRPRAWPTSCPARRCRSSPTSTTSTSWPSPRSRPACTACA